MPCMRITAVSFAVVVWGKPLLVDEKKMVGREPDMDLDENYSSTSF